MSKTIEKLEHVAVLIGTRPEAIKLLPVIRSLERVGLSPRVVVTGQHRELLYPILEELGIVADEELAVMEANDSLAGLSARVLERMDGVFARSQPQLVLVQGDTTSAAMAALAAFYAELPVAHVEAGLRTHHRRNPFPEEMNRRLIGCLADYHFAPTERARQNLLGEGFPDDSIRVVGNTVIDALVHARDHLIPARGEGGPETAERREIVLVTCHRRESFGRDLAVICDGIGRLAGELSDRIEVVFPVHLNPNVHSEVHRRLDGIDNVRLLAPLTYLSFVSTMLRARLIITDSGGIQEEAAFLGIPLLVTRRTSERSEAIAAGVAELVGPDAERLVGSARALLTDEELYRSRAVPTMAFGDGRAADRIVDTLLHREDAE